MACQSGLLAEDCAADHWCVAFGGHRERGEWRANCPYPGCDAERALKWDVPGKNVRWRSHCAEHDKETLKPVIAERLKGCLPQRRTGQAAISPDDIIALVLADMPPQSKYLGLLELAGMSTSDAVDKLGVTRTNRYRVVSALRQNRRR